jgi:hypothetical protein
MIIKKYLLIPLILTIVGFFIYDMCEDVICLFPGNGFPVGYYYNNHFNPLFFVLDFFIITIFYFILLKIFNLLKKK